MRIAALSTSWNELTAAPCCFFLRQMVGLVGSSSDTTVADLSDNIQGLVTS